MIGEEEGRGEPDNATSNDQNLDVRFCHDCRIFPFDNMADKIVPSYNALESNDLAVRKTGYSDSASIRVDI